MIHPTVKKYLGKAPKGTSESEKSTTEISSVNQEIGSESTKIKVVDRGIEKIWSLPLDISSKVGQASG